MTNRYASILDQTASLREHQPSPALEELRNFCVGVTEFMRQQEQGGRCRLEPGLLVGMGLEWRIMIYPRNAEYKFVLLRAYIPQDGDGFPVQLDAYAEDLIVCKNIGALQRELEKILKLRQVQDQIILRGSETW